MINRDQAENAGLYALELLPEPERGDFERELRLNPDLREEVDNLQDIAVIASVALAAPATPSRIVLEAIHHRIKENRATPPRWVKARRAVLSWGGWAAAAGFALLATGTGITSWKTSERVKWLEKRLGLGSAAQHSIGEGSGFGTDDTSISQVSSTAAQKAPDHDSESTRLSHEAAAIARWLKADPQHGRMLEQDLKKLEQDLASIKAVQSAYFSPEPGVTHLSVYRMRNPSEPAPSKESDEAFTEQLKNAVVGTITPGSQQTTASKDQKDTNSLTEKEGTGSPAKEETSQTSHSTQTGSTHPSDQAPLNEQENDSTTPIKKPKTINDYRSFQGNSVQSDDILLLKNPSTGRQEGLQAKGDNSEFLWDWKNRIVYRSEWIGQQVDANFDADDIPSNWGATLMDDVVKRSAAETTQAPQKTETTTSSSQQSEQTSASSSSTQAADGEITVATPSGDTKPVISTSTTTGGSSPLVLHLPQTGDWELYFPDRYISPSDGQRDMLWFTPTGSNKPVLLGQLPNDTSFNENGGSFVFKLPSTTPNGMFITRQIPSSQPAGTVIFQGPAGK